MILASQPTTWEDVALCAVICLFVVLLAWINRD